MSLQDVGYAYHTQASLPSVADQTLSLSLYLGATSTVERHFDAWAIARDDFEWLNSRCCYRPMGQRRLVLAHITGGQERRIEVTAWYAMVALLTAHLRRWQVGGYCDRVLSFDAALVFQDDSEKKDGVREDSGWVWRSEWWVFWRVGPFEPVFSAAFFAGAQGTRRSNIGL